MARHFPKGIFMTNFATTSLMPLIARIVIAAAMLTSGWANCFSQIEINTKIADGLRSMEVEVHTAVVAESNDGSKESIDVGIEEGTEAGTEKGTEAGTEEGAKESTEKISEEATHSASQMTTRGVNRIVWLIHEQWPSLGGWGMFLAWTAGVMQLLAGVLLLVGLFTRLASLSVVIASGMATYIVSGSMHGMFAMNPFDWPLDSHQFIQLFAGVCLCVLALGLVFSGAGSFSIDARHSPDSSETK
jgi:uncharacterized membrane protein YphA (DoxX/SURF4 family)